MPQMTTWLQFKTLVRRNFLVKWRLKQASFQEMFMPIYFVVLLAILKTFAYKPTAFPNIPSTEILTRTVETTQKNFFVAPDFAAAERLMQTMNETSAISYTMFGSQELMDSAYKNLSMLDQIDTVGILFQGNNSISEYAIRLGFGNIPSGFLDGLQGNCRNGNGNDTAFCPANNYFNQGFASVQMAIDTAIAKLLDPNFDRMNIAVKMFPKDPTLSNTEAFKIIGPLYLVLALGPFLTFLLVFVVYEKEKKIKEGMKMMGLSDIAYWFSWGFVYAASLLVMTLIMTMIGYFGNLFPLSNFFLVFLLMFIYGISIEMLGFMLTPFFSKARTAGAVGGFLSIFMSLLFLATELTDDFPESAVWAISLLSPTAFAYAMGKVFYFEITGEGAHFYNIMEGPDPLYIGLVMMLVDIVLYFLLTLYLDSVVPGEYGQGKSIFYCLKPSYWCKGSRGKERSRSLRRSLSSRESNAGNQDFEAVAQDFVGKEAITFQGIRKVFQKPSIFEGGSGGEETVAIHNFTLDIYKGQITALLGHNGAGKTTLFNILTGFVPVTSGAATVLGYDVTDSDDLSEIRKITGVCPQHDILLDFLSVIEHLDVFAGLKGFEGEEKTEEIERVIDIIGLADQRDTFAKKLSGGQKRKLSVGIAILGDPKILILDEPTAGMDPYSRRKLWDLLRSNQGDRVTLLTTHFMDEADILADRKAIIAKGKLKCVGSSLFLKNRFGCGYHLGIVSKSHEDARAITSCVSTHIQESELQRSIGMEHAYTLPLHQVSNFSTLFADLDKRQEELNVQSYGVSMTTLEEVFLKIGEDDEVESAETNGDEVEANHKSIGYQNPVETDEEENVAINVNNHVPTFDPSQSQLSENAQSGQVISQLMRRTMLINLRSPGYIIFAIIFPMVLIVVGSWLLTQSPASSDTDNPALIDITYKNNFDAFKQKNILYKGLSGTANTTFIDNTQDGITMEENALIDSELLTEGFYPHPIGLNIGTFTSSQVSYVVRYNTSFVRSIPAAINIFSNTLSSLLSNGTSPDIVTYCKDWPQTGTVLGTFNANLFGASLMIALAMVLSTSFAAGNPVKEREEKIRAQLRVSGVKFFNYWFAFFLSDYIIYFIMAILFIICIVGFQVEGLNNGGAILALIFLLIGWGFGCLLASYCANFLFDRYETAQSSWPGLVQLLSMIPYIIVSTLDLTGNSDAALALTIIFSLLSPYFVGFAGIYYCIRVYTIYWAMGKANNIPISAYFDWSQPMVPFTILMSYLHIIILSFLLVVADIKKSGGQLPFCKSKQVGSTEWNSLGANDDLDEGEDDDVVEERIKVAEISQQSGLQTDGPVVLMQGIRKEYEKRNDKKCQSCRKSNYDADDENDSIKVAVRNLSMTVYPGEVVGLLGPNGAGKTTALNVLIADTGATKGRVSIGGHSVTSSFSDAFKAMGYCPQNNPLWEQITLREHLEIYAAARGVAPDRVPSTVENFLSALDIEEHSNKRAKNLSGGTKRKLCFAISMLGNPQVVLLDEPSTGMDPKTKRFLWNTISTAFEGTNRGAILTTHYMEEADALCSRVGIMVLGQLRCLGSTQHLKDKFGQGYILEIKLDHQIPEDGDQEGGEEVAVESNELETFVKELFPGVEESEKFGNRLTYKIKRSDVKSLANVFSALENAKSELGIEEYSFSQSTLEQVFLRFAKEQAERDEEEQLRNLEKERARKNKAK